MLVLQKHPDRAVLHVVDLEKPVMAMHRHIATEETCQIAELVVMDFGIAVALIVDLADVDVRNRLSLSHQGLLIFILIRALRLFAP